MGFGRPFPDRLKRYDPQRRCDRSKTGAETCGLHYSGGVLAATAEEALGSAFQQLQRCVGQVVRLSQDRHTGLLEHLVLREVGHFRGHVHVADPAHS
jgi:hypothetical protein